MNGDTSPSAHRILSLLGLLADVLFWLVNLLMILGVLNVSAILGAVVLAIVRVSCRIFTSKSKAVTILLNSFFVIVGVQIIVFLLFLLK